MNEKETLAFADWLLYNCTIKEKLYTTGIDVFWTLNKDYANSWDGSDVKCYTTREIHELYIKSKQ